MQNQLLIEELQRLQQQRQQQELLQQQLQLPPSLSDAIAAATAAKYPLSSALLGNLSSLGGTGPVLTNGLTPPATANPSAETLLLQQIQQQLQGGGGLQVSSPPASVTPPVAAAAAAASPTALLGAAVGPSLAAAINASATSAVNASTNPLVGSSSMSSEELLRKLAAAGLLGSTISQSLVNSSLPLAAAVAAAAPTPVPPTTGASLPSLLGALVAEQGQEQKREAEAATVQDRKREAGAATRQQEEPKRQRLEKPSPLLPMQRGLDDDDKAAAAAVHVLASVAAMEMKQRSLPTPKKLPAKNDFKLPPAQEKDHKFQQGVVGMPKLTAFQKAWDNVKTKGMQKEIFLRKLHGGKVVPRQNTPGAAGGTATAPARGLKGKGYHAV